MDLLVNLRGVQGQTVSRVDKFVDYGNASILDVIMSSDTHEVVNLYLINMDQWELVPELLSMVSTRRKVGCFMNPMNTTYTSVSEASLEWIGSPEPLSDIGFPTVNMMGIVNNITHPKLPEALLSLFQVDGNKKSPLFAKDVEIVRRPDKDGKQFLDVWVHNSDYYNHWVIEQQIQLSMKEVKP